MSTAEMLEQLKLMDNTQRLALIEAATRLVRDDLSRPLGSRAAMDIRLSASAAAIHDLYEPGGELTEWTTLDGEEVVDDSAHHKG